MSRSTTSSGLRLAAPVFSTRDVPRWLEHYRTLGFTTEAHDGYGFAWLDDVEVHVARNPDHDPQTTAACAYLHVDDPDALWRRWSVVAGGRNLEPADTDYGTREGAHFDLDNNLIRYGAER